MVRFDPKGFRQRRPKGGNGWEYSVKGTRLVPYRLPDLVAAPSSVAVFVVEGEKDADRAAGIGIVATTCAMGAGKWQPEYNEHFRGRSVYIVPDNDKPGRKRAASGADLHGIAQNIKVVELPGVPEKGDLSDWLDQGHTKAELGEQVKAAPEWKPAMADNQPPPFAHLLTGAELLALDLKPRFICVRGVMVEGQPMIVGGRSKTLKTSVACDLAVSLGSGTPFLGRFDTHRVAWGSGPANRARRRSAKRPSGLRRARAASVWPTWIVCRFRPAPPVSTRPPRPPGGSDSRGRLRVAILDPLYLALLSPETASGESNVFLMGALLQGLTKLGQDTGCTVVLLHHFRKGGQPDEENPAGLDGLLQSGIAESERQWLLLQRRTAYQADGVHNLWMRCGGSAGHSSLWA